MLKVQHKFSYNNCVLQPVNFKWIKNSSESKVVILPFDQVTQLLVFGIKTHGGILTSQFKDILRSNDAILIDTKQMLYQLMVQTKIVM